MASETISTFEAAVQALTLIEAEYEDVEIIAALPNQDYDATGALIDVVDVTFRLRGHPGSFQVQPVFIPEWTAIALSLIAVKRDIVNAIYDGLGSLAETVLGPPFVSPFNPLTR